jgi:hypothetical protein
MPPALTLESCLAPAMIRNMLGTIDCTSDADWPTVPGQPG